MANIPAKQYRGLLTAEFQMSNRERTAASFLLVDSNSATLTSLRTAITSLGYSNPSIVNSYETGLQALRDRSFSHVLFNSSIEGSFSSHDFLNQAMQIEDLCFYVAVTGNPQVDDVFELLRLGARGFMVSPLTVQNVDDTILSATKGEPFSRSILEARNRNEAFSAMVSASLDRTAQLLSQKERYKSASRDYDKAMKRFRESTDIAKTFCKGSVDDLVEQYVEFFVELAQGPASRLGRLRSRLRTKRKSSGINEDS